MKGGVHSTSCHSSASGFQSGKPSGPRERTLGWLDIVSVCVADEQFASFGGDRSWSLPNSVLVLVLPDPHTTMRTPNAYSKNMYLHT